jgi:hypothetical protein
LPHAYLLFRSRHILRLELTLPGVNYWKGQVFHTISETYLNRRKERGKPICTDAHLTAQVDSQGTSA